MLDVLEIISNYLYARKERAHAYTEKSFKYYRDLVAEFVGEDNVKWAEWWTDAAQSGKADSRFTVNNIEYSTLGMNFYEFWEIVVDR
jgi:hypothetical protein